MPTLKDFLYLSNISNALLSESFYQVVLLLLHNINKHFFRNSNHRGSRALRWFSAINPQRARGQVSVCGATVAQVKPRPPGDSHVLVTDGSAHTQLEPAAPHTHTPVWWTDHFFTHTRGWNQRVSASSSWSDIFSQLEAQRFVSPVASWIDWMNGASSPRKWTWRRVSSSTTERRKWRVIQSPVNCWLRWNKRRKRLFWRPSWETRCCWRTVSWKSAATNFMTSTRTSWRWETDLLLFAVCLCATTDFWFNMRDLNDPTRRF